MAIRIGIGLVLAVAIALAVLVGLSQLRAVTAERETRHIAEAIGLRDEHELVGYRGCEAVFGPCTYYRIYTHPATATTLQAQQPQVEALGYRFSNYGSIAPTMIFSQINLNTSGVLQSNGRERPNSGDEPVVKEWMFKQNGSRLMIITLYTAPRTAVYTFNGRPLDDPIIVVAVAEA